MPATDKIHDAVKNALVKDGWTITDDPFVIRFEDVKLYADLAAERPLGAERLDKRIVVEIKSFLSTSAYHDWEAALGQYQVYRQLLQVTDPQREIYLAVGSLIYANFFSRKSVQLVRQSLNVKLLVVRLDTEEVDQWVK